MSAALDAVDPSSRHNRPSVTEYGFWLFLAIAIGRINMLIPGLSALPLAKIAIIIPCVTLYFQRKALAPLSSDGKALMKTGLWIVGLAALLTPVSFWPGSSRNFMIFGLPPMIAATAIGCSMRRSWRFLKTTLLILLLSGFVLGALATLHHSGGRAFDSSTDLDPNDLAYVLVTVIPLGVAFFILSKSWIPKTVFGVVTATAAVALLLTQSRGGMLGFLTILVLLVFVPIGVGARGTESRYVRGLRASSAVAIAIACCGMIAWNGLPESAQARYMTLLHLGNDYNTNLHDKTGREDIWMQGLRAFSVRPWGYGPQTFQMVDVHFGGQFRAPHNSYLQALVELGPIGLLLFIRMYLLALRALHHTRSGALRPANPSADSVECAVLARALQFGLVGNMVSAFFLSDAYAMLPWVISGLSAAMSSLQPLDRQAPRPTREVQTKKQLTEMFRPQDKRSRGEPAKRPARKQPPLAR